MDKISIIIPTYNEKENISQLTVAIKNVITKKISAKYEIIIVDDNSPDGTGKIADKLVKKDKLIRVIHRKGKNGLSSAVMDGVSKSKGNIICVMDADFSHPPEKIAEMYEEIKKGKDLVIGSRHVRGGKIIGWNLKRKLMSKFATILARPLTSAKDPMSGFFMFAKSKIDIKNINSKGFKILLELLFKNKNISVGEVPIIFVNRQKGKSKASIKEIFLYLRNLGNYYLQINGIKQFLKFISVGFTGLIINLIVYYIFYSLIGVNYILSAVMAFLVALTNNFFLNKIWTFKESVSNNLARKYLKFFITSLLAFFLQLGALLGLTELLGINPLLSQPISIVLATLINFYGSKKWTFKN